MIVDPLGGGAMYVIGKGISFWAIRKGINFCDFGRRNGIKFVSWAKQTNK